MRGSSLEAERALGSLGFEPAAGSSSRAARSRAAGGRREADLTRDGLGCAAAESAAPTVEVAAAPRVRCRRGHALEEFRTPHDGFECDLCGHRAASNTQLWGCRACDHDICRSCRETMMATARAEAPGDAAVGAAAETASNASTDTRGRLPGSVLAAAAARAGERAQRAGSQGRALVTKVGGAARRATSPISAAFFARGDGRRTSGGGDASPDAGSDDETPAQAQSPVEAPAPPRGEDLAHQVQGELVQLRRDLVHQIAQRKAAERTLASEKARCEFLETQNRDLTRVAEEKLRGQERCQNVETAELEDQLGALRELKRQLFQRIQLLESERSTLTRERDEATSDRSCVVCMDRLANTVFYRCLHLVCCDGCARRVQACPVCRHPVRDRLTVFMM